MAVIRPFVDEFGEQQTDQKQNRSTKKQLYAFDPDSPLNIYELGGHSIPDAPEYTLQEPVPKMVRKVVAGYNQTELEHVDDEYIQGEDYTLNIPESRESMAELLISVQRRTQRNFIYFTVPNDPCPDTCDYFAELRGESGRLGEYQETTGVIAFDNEGDGGAVVGTAMLRVQGASRKYNGIRVQADSVTGLAAVYSVTVGSLDDCSDDSFCPYQIGYAFHSDGVAVPDGVRYSQKWGAVGTTALDGTALGAASLITDSVFFRGDIYVAYSDAFKATSLSGGVARSINGTSALVDVGITSVGIQTLLIAGTKLHAFGEAGEWHHTTDGETWTTVAGSLLGSTDIFCSAYNPFTKRIFVGGAAGVAYAIEGSIVTTLTGLGSADLLSCAVAGPDHVAFGATDSVLYENFQEANGGSFASTKTFATGAIQVLLADKRSTNLVASVGVKVYQRSIMSRQDWVDIADSPDGSIILSGDAGWEEHRRGSNYFVFGTTDGGIFEAQVCSPCKSE